MRLGALIIALCILLGSLSVAEAKGASPKKAAPAPKAEPVEITADESLEWHQVKNIYVAKGNAKAVSGDLTVTADLLTAHKRDTPKVKAKKTDNKAAGTGDIDKLTAEGNVVILKSGSRITGDLAVDDLDKKVVIVTGDNLRYENDKQVVTARESLEYWEDRKTAIARGKATAVKGDRRITGDLLTAEFRPQPNGKDQLNKLSAAGNVTVVTKNDVVRGDRGVYDAARDIAVITGHVRITRGDGLELTGDVGEADFKTNQSRLINSGGGRVRALLPAKTSSKTSGGAKSKVGAP